MVIPNLGLSDFRNYKRLEIEFGPRLHFLVGPNGMGKTNLLEALYLCTHLKSYRSAKLNPLIKQGEHRSLIDFHFEDRQVRHLARIELLKQNKRVFLDQKPLRLSSDYIQRFFSILFAPDQLAHFKEFPGQRRAFFDRALSILEPSYFAHLKEFERIKANKTQLLRQGRLAELGPWNKLMAHCIPNLVLPRARLVDELNQKLGGYFSRFSKKGVPLFLIYRPDLNPRDPDEALTLLTQKAPAELAQGFCTLGPHKDNYQVTMGQKMDRVELSQGEYRTAFLSLLFGLNEIFGTRCQIRPLLLLDDLFSELDKEVVKALFGHLEELDNQIFITGTDIPQAFQGAGKRYFVLDGTVEAAPLTI